MMWMVWTLSPVLLGKGERAAVVLFGVTLRGLKGSLIFFLFFLHTLENKKKKKKTTHMRVE